MEDSKMLDELIIAQTKAAKAQIELLKTKLESANAENEELKLELNEYDPNLPEEKSRLSPQRFIDALKSALELANAEIAKLNRRLESENKKLSEANTKLRAALEKIVTLSTYAGKITKDVEHYMTMRIASRAPEIAREALKNPASDGRGE